MWKYVVSKSGIGTVEQEYSKPINEQIIKKKTTKYGVPIRKRSTGGKATTSNNILKRKRFPCGMRMIRVATTLTMTRYTQSWLRTITRRIMQTSALTGARYVYWYEVRATQLLIKLILPIEPHWDIKCANSDRAHRNIMTAENEVDEAIRDRIN